MQTTAESQTYRLRPFWGRIMVIPSSLDEEQRASGLILPVVGESYTPVRRGVVAHVDKVRHELADSIDELVPGTVVYYIDGLRIADAVMLNRSEIVAYEVPE